MELSLEIPLPHIKEFLPLTDFPFGLAQLVLEDKKYRELMQGCLLDNGMYELGESLSVGDLVKAATLCNPKALVAPDWEDNRDHTVNAAYDCLEARKGYEWTVGALVQGRNLEERIECFVEMQKMHLRPIGFPFRSPRDETIARIHKARLFRNGEWYHLFGLRDIKELKWNFPGRWTLDTGKPFKGFRMDKEPIRGHGRLNLHRTLPTPEVWGLAAWNIAWMRKEMNA